MVIYHSTPTLNLLLTPMEKWKRQSQKQKFQKCLQLIIWKTKVLLSFLRVRGHIDICFFFVWKLIRLQIIFTKTAGIEIDLTVAPVCQKYWYKRFFFWKLYILFYTLLSTWRRSGYIKVDINLIYISILKALSLFSRFVLSHFWKNICLDKTKHAKLYCKQKLKKSIILHLQKCNILTQFLKTKLPKKLHISIISRSWDQTII